MNIFLTCILACGEKTLDTSPTDTRTESNTVTNCTPLSEEECDTSQSCFPITATPITYNEENTCWEHGTQEFTECMSTDMVCGQGQAITYARPDPDADCMMFTSTCIPLEWDICDETEFPECPQ